MKLHFLQSNLSHVTLQEMKEMRSPKTGGLCI